MHWGRHPQADILPAATAADGTHPTGKHSCLFIQSLLCVRSLTAEEGLDMKHLRSSRRSRLPAPRPDTGDFSLWGLLRKNIGKDLSKISMPVSLNEPLSMLQVLYILLSKISMPVSLNEPLSMLQVLYILLSKISMPVSLNEPLSMLQVLYIQCSRSPCLCLNEPLIMLQVLYTHTPVGPDFHACIAKWTSVCSMYCTETPVQDLHVCVSEQASQYVPSTVHPHTCWSRLSCLCLWMSHIMVQLLYTPPVQDLRTFFSQWASQYAPGTVHTPLQDLHACVSEWASQYAPGNVHPQSSLRSLCLCCWMSLSVCSR